MDKQLLPCTHPICRASLLGGMHLSHVFCRIRSITVAGRECCRCILLKHLTLLFPTPYHPPWKDQVNPSLATICLVGSSYLLVLAWRRRWPLCSPPPSFSLVFIVLLSRPLRLFISLRLPPRAAITTMSNGTMPKRHVPRCLFTTRGQSCVCLSCSLLRSKDRLVTRQDQRSIYPLITTIMKVRSCCLDLIRRCGTRGEQI